MLCSDWMKKMYVSNDGGASVFEAATVRFIGEENAYKFGCEEAGYEFCRECEHINTCAKQTDALFTVGKLYEAYFVEYWEGERNGLHVIGNDGYLHDYIPLELFEIISDPDHVLNNYEAIVRCLKDTYDPVFELKCGAIYKAIGRDKDGLYLVMDESRDCYFYSPHAFEVLDDPHNILDHQSVYNGFWQIDDTDKPDYVAAHAYSSNHRAQLSEDTLCGCFNCLEIFDPKEIVEWWSDKYFTAVCPYCGIDSVIGASSGYPITKAFLQKMKKYWC